MEAFCWRCMGQARCATSVSSQLGARRGAPAKGAGGAHNNSNTASSLYGKRRGSIEPLPWEERAIRLLGKAALFCSGVRNTAESRV